MLELAAQVFEHRQNAAQFFFMRNSGRAGAGGFAADIDDVGSGALHRDCTRGGGFGIEKEAAVGEAVRRDVEHAHDQRAFAQEQGARRETQAEFAAMKHRRLLKHDLGERLSGQFAAAAKSLRKSRFCKSVPQGLKPRDLCKSCSFMSDA